MRGRSRWTALSRSRLAASRRAAPDFFTLRVLGGGGDAFSLTLGSAWCWAEACCLAIAAGGATSRASDKPRVVGILIRLHLHAVCPGLRERRPREEAAVSHGGKGCCGCLPGSVRGGMPGFGVGYVI